MNLESTSSSSPVFIMGIHRSGTTLLQAMLDGHPQLVVNAAETHFFQSFLPKVQGLSDEDKTRLAEQILFATFHSSVYSERYYSHIAYADVWQAFLARLGRSQKHNADYLSAAVLAFGEVSGQFNGKTRYWIEKTPLNELYVGKIFTWWEDAKCIHVIRDPRAVYASLKIRAHRNKRHLSMSAHVHNWQRSARLAQESRDCYGEDRYAIVHYEDLLRSPQDQMRSMADFLEINNHETLLAPTKSGGIYPWKGNSARDRHFGTVDSGYLDAWENDVTQREIDRLEALIGSEMVRNGYQLKTRRRWIAQLGAVRDRASILGRRLKDKHLRR